MKLDELDPWLGIPATRVAEPPTSGFDVDSNALSVEQLNWLILSIAKLANTLSTDLSPDLTDVMLRSNYVPSIPQSTHNQIESIVTRLTKAESDIKAIDTDSLEIKGAEYHKHSVDDAIQSIAADIKQIKSDIAYIKSHYVTSDGNTSMPYITLGATRISVD